MTIGGGRSQPALRRRASRPATARRPRGARGRRGGIGIRRPGPRALLVLLVVIAGLVGGWLWVRDSSLVAVQRVRVSGASGPDAAQIRSALVAAARNMTTLDVQMSQLQTAVGPYPVVKRLQVQTQFPHGMRIQVVEQVPVAIVVAGGRRTAVSGDGTLLHDVGPTSSLPTISLGLPPGGTHLTGYALTEARLLAAAPYQLLAKVSQVSDGAAHGLVAQLRNGPNLYFGDSRQLGLKWTAVTDVLADPGSAAAVYIDVTDPSRPAAGVGSDTATAAASAASGTSGASGAAGTSGASATTTSATPPATTTPATAATATAPAGTATAPVATGAAPTGSTVPTGTGTAGG